MSRIQVECLPENVEGVERALYAVWVEGIRKVQCHENGTTLLFFTGTKDDIVVAMSAGAISADFERLPVANDVIGTTPQLFAGLT